MPEDTGRVHRVMGWGLGSSAWAEGVGEAATAHPPIWPPGSCVTEMFIFGETGWDFFS